MMNADIAAEWETSRFGEAHQLYTGGAGNSCQMNFCTGLAHQGEEALAGREGGGGAGQVLERRPVAGDESLPPGQHVTLQLEITMAGAKVPLTFKIYKGDQFVREASPQPPFQPRLGRS